MSEPSSDAPEWEELHQAELTSEAAVRYGDLYGIARDLGFVIECCERLLAVTAQPEEARDGVAARALWIAALIAYERVFAGGARERLTQDDVRAVPNDGAIAVSDHYRALRDRHVAHSVNPHEMSKVCAVLPPRSGEHHDAIGIGVVSISLTGFGEKDLHQLGALATELRAQVTARARDLEDVLREEAIAIGVETLRQRRPAKLTIPGPEHVNINRRRWDPDSRP